MNAASEGDRAGKALVALFLLVNGIVLLNALLHDPRIGYDARDHVKYIAILAKARLPAPGETREFFSPPLPYVLPALLFASGLFKLWTVAKFAQVLNVLYSIGLTVAVVRICELIRPGNALLKAASLALLGMMPVFFKTFAFVRPEPLLACLSAIAVYQALTTVNRANKTLARAILLGGTFGLLILTRQQGFFVILAVGLFMTFLMLRHKSARQRLFKTVVVSGLVAFAVGGCFYVRFYRTYGTFMTFNRPPAPSFSWANQPPEFYFSLGGPALFRDPVRDAFPNQLIPKFYSEFWGDYEAYFVVYGRDIESNTFASGKDLARRLAEGPSDMFETNRDDASRYLGRVNLVSLLPTTVLLAGVVLGMLVLGRAALTRDLSERDTMVALLQLVIIISGAGYLWFLIMYPNLTRGDTIKATYLVHVFPFVAILSAELLLRVRRHYRRLHAAIAILLVAVALHNLPVVITRYNVLTRHL